MELRKQINEVGPLFFFWGGGGGGMEKGYTYRSCNVSLVKVYEAPDTINMIMAMVSSIRLAAKWFLICSIVSIATLMSCQNIIVWMLKGLLFHLTFFSFDIKIL